jgi:hypothetical protein
MKKEISIALVMSVISQGLYALPQNGNSLMQEHLDYQKNYKSIPKLDAPCIKTGGGGIELFLAPKDSDKKGGVMDG